jgi:hypothetical protein
MKNISFIDSIDMKAIWFSDRTERLDVEEAFGRRFPRLSPSGSSSSSLRFHALAVTIRVPFRLAGMSLGPVQQAH